MFYSDLITHSSTHISSESQQVMRNLRMLYDVRSYTSYLLDLLILVDNKHLIMKLVQKYEKTVTTAECA